MRIDKLFAVEALAKLCSLSSIANMQLRKLEGAVTCFLFHRVCADRHMGVTLPIFKSVIESIIRRFDVLSIDEACDYLAHGGRSKRYAVITFDDGYLDNYTLALPVLREYSVPATLFVCTGFIDSGYSNWDALDSALLARKDSVLDLRECGLGSHQFAQPEQRRAVLAHLHGALKNMAHEKMEMIVNRLTGGACPHLARTMMNWDELGEFSRTQRMTIGAHTITHPNLTSVAQDVMREEIRLSKILLEERLSMPVRHFAYPSGISSGAVADAVRAAGFTSASSVEEGVNFPGCDMFAIKRRSVMQEGCVGGRGGYSDAVFFFSASGSRPAVRKFFRKMGWV